MSYLKFKDQAVNILTKALKYEDLCRLRADLLGVIQKQVSGGTLEDVLQQWFMYTFRKVYALIT